MSFATDTPVSLPAPVGGPGAEPLIGMYGFCLTKWGVRPDLSAADHEHLSALAHAPSATDTLRADAGLDGR